MRITRVVAIAAFVGLSLSGSGIASAAEKEDTRLADAAGVLVSIAPRSDYSPKLERPAILPVLYVTLGAMQALDVYSTRAAISAGAREANPTASAFTGSTGSLLGLKAATTASTIFFAERLRKKSRVGAIVMLVAINGATAAVAMHNMRNAQALSTR